MEKDTQVKLPRILVELGEKKTIMKLLNVSYPTISSALAGKTRTKKALRIRALALKRGAVEVRSQACDTGASKTHQEIIDKSSR